MSFALPYPAPAIQLGQPSPVCTTQRSGSAQPLDPLYPGWSLAKPSVDQRSLSPSDRQVSSRDRWRCHCASHEGCATFSATAGGHASLAHHDCGSSHASLCSHCPATAVSCHFSSSHQVAIARASGCNQNTLEREVLTRYVHESMCVCVCMCVYNYIYACVCVCACVFCARVACCSR